MRWKRETGAPGLLGYPGWGMRPWVALLVAGCVACGPRGSRRTAATYVDPQSCRPCHVEISNSYQQVAIARSLYRPGVAPVIEDYERNNHFYHASWCFSQ